MFATASILMRIRHLGDGLPPTARRIATYIAEHAEEVIRMSITEVAEQTGASEGSIVGLCRRLGASAASRSSRSCCRATWSSRCG